MKWGLFGGSFDPIHLGHLQCAQEVGERFSLDRIVLIPASRQPLKTDHNVTPFFHRCNMVRLAIEGNPLFCLSEIEASREGKSYSVDTVTHFRTHYADVEEFYFIVGQDAFLEIGMWKDWERLLSLCNFVVMTRPGYTVTGLEDALPADRTARFRYDADGKVFRGPEGYGIFFRTLTFLDISSTGIRERSSHGLSIRYLIPEAVHSYIIRHALYSQAAGR